jgi:hypothetical protein
MFNKNMSINPLSQNATARTSFRYLILLCMPFFLGFLTLRMAEQFPGRIEFIHWQTFVSFTFLICGCATIFFIWRQKINVIAKSSFTVLAAVLFLSLAFLASVRSNCGEQSKYIGTAKIKKASISCG